MLRSTTIALCAMLIPVLSTAAPQTTEKSSDILQFRAAEKTLPNGLHVVAVPTGFPNIVAVYINVRTGSRNEVEPGKSGFAHFFEHMMFRGTKEVPNDDFSLIIAKNGGETNAFTDHDYTAFYEQIHIHRPAIVTCRTDGKTPDHDVVGALLVQSPAQIAQILDGRLARL